MMHELKIRKCFFEPVAWRNMATGHVTTSAVVVMDWDDEKEQVQSLYAERPVPVAAVLSDRNKVAKNLDLEQCGYVDGWNACIDEVNRLNPK